MISALFRRPLSCFNHLSLASANFKFSEYFAERDKHERVLYLDE